MFTIGHSTRSLEEFLHLLHAHHVVQLADIRTVPRSRRHPHFSTDALSAALPAAGIAYRHMPGLGGLRKPRRDSTNAGWRHAGFRGYADYMATPEFERALDDLIDWSSSACSEEEAKGAQQGDQGADTVIMCAEAVWWRCHRQLVADALVARGVTVRHIMSATAVPVHSLTDFARVANGRVTYPGLI
jgi:uncharacterized protein (DUF488 family)